MARGARIDEAGLVHHVTGRSHSFAPAFPCPLARNRFLELLTPVTDTLEWEIGAFSVLTTHYHFLLHTPEATLSQGMRRLHGDYARWLNRHRGTRGPVWGERFHSRPVASGLHIVRAAVYIDRNAVAAGLVADPRDWPWSSFSANACLVPPRSWHSSGLVHRSLGDDEATVGATYADLVERGLRGQGTG